MKCICIFFYGNNCFAGYLQQQQLHDVGAAFCEKSPHLKEEWEYLSQGYEMFPMTEQTTLLDKLCEHNMIRMRGKKYN